jgi:hypothetical protein
MVSSATVVSSTNKSDGHDITAILLKAAVYTRNPTNQLLKKLLHVAHFQQYFIAP